MDRAALDAQPVDHSMLQLRWLFAWGLKLDEHDLTGLDKDAIRHTALGR